MDHLLFLNEQVYVWNKDKESIEETANHHSVQLPEC